jgi:hypothetical protein
VVNAEALVQKHGIETPATQAAVARESQTTPSPYPIPPYPLTPYPLPPSPYRPPYLLPPTPNPYPLNP